MIITIPSFHHSTLSNFIHKSTLHHFLPSFECCFSPLFRETSSTPHLMPEGCFSIPIRSSLLVQASSRSWVSIILCRFFVFSPLFPPIPHFTGGCLSGHPIQLSIFHLLHSFITPLFYSSIHFPRWIWVSPHRPLDSEPRLYYSMGFV